MKTIIDLILLGVVLGTTTLPSDAATNNWRGLFNSAWSNPNNWEPAGVPQNGDDLNFEGGSATVPLVMVNDLTDLTVNTLAFNGGAWELRGNELGIQSAIKNNSDGLVEIKCAVRLEGTSTFSGWSGFDAKIADVRVSGPINLNGHLLRLMAREDTTVDLAGPISGEGRVSVFVETANYFSPGTVKFSGAEANTFTGSVTLTFENATRFSDVQGSTLVLDKQSGLAVPGALVVGDNCEVKLNRPHQIFNSAPVSLAPGAKFLLQGNNQTVGSLSMAARVGQIWTVWKPIVDTDGATLSVEGNISASNSHPSPDFLPIIKGKLGLPPGNHLIQVSGNSPNGLHIEAEILGEGGFTKTGPRSLLLSGNSTFDGDVVLQEGATFIYHGHALGDPSGAAILDGGELHVENVAVGLKTLWVNQVSPNTRDFGGNLVVSGVSSWAGPVTLNTNLMVNGTSMAFSGAVSGPGSLYLFNGTTHIQGSEANTYEGTTYAYGNLLDLNKPAGVRAISATLRVNGSGNGGVGEVRWQQDYQSVGVDVTLFPDALINLNGHRDDFGPLTFNGGAVSTGAGELGIYGLVTANTSGSEATISGRLGLPPGLHEFHVFDGAAFPDLRIDATILGAGHLRKTGPGQMWLTAPNTYEGLTTVAEGALSVLDPNGLGAAVTGTTVNEGATLEVNFAGIMPERLAIRGTGIAGNGALGVFGDVTLRTTFPAIYAAIDLTANATIGVAPDSQLTVNGTISGIGNLTKVGPGTLWFGGTDHNTYSGETFINEGRFIMGKPSGITAVPGPLNVGTAAGLSAFAGHVASYQILGNIFVNRNGLLYLNGQVENVDHLWLSEGGDVQTSPPGVLFLKSGGSIQVVPGGVGDSAIIGGILDMDAGAHIINVGASSALSGPNLEITALVTSSLGPVTPRKYGPGTLRLSANNTYSGTTVVDEGILRVDGVQPQSSVQVNAAGTLQGIGVIDSIGFGGNGVVAPGASPGILTCNNLLNTSGSGILEMELDGPTPGPGGYDHLNVNGIVTLSGITLRVRANFIANTNQQFVLIDNQSANAVQGTFNGLAQNATVTAADQIFRISYFGRDGNDVVLTKIADVFRPVLMIERVAPSSVRLRWPTNDPAFLLQFNTNLGGATWAAVSPSPLVAGTNNVVTNGTVDARRFYRLFKP
jgi:autotransporter-associated beta strand protein